MQSGLKTLKRLYTISVMLFTWQQLWLAGMGEWRSLGPSWLFTVERCPYSEVSCSQLHLVGTAGSVLMERCPSFMESLMQRHQCITLSMNTACSQYISSVRVFLMYTCIGHAVPSERVCACVRACVRVCIIYVSAELECHLNQPLLFSSDTTPLRSQMERMLS